jgi:nickel/cobalt transporter (NiCoT) family protein
LASGWKWRRSRSQAQQAKITTDPLAAIADIPLDYAGYGSVILFFASWLIAIAVWRFGRVEQRWSANLTPARTTASE